jgi:hypothetical protein
LAVNARTPPGSLALLYASCRFSRRRRRHV